MEGYEDAYPSNSAPFSNGLLTGSLVFYGDGTRLLATSYYYDSMKRIVQSHSENHLGGFEHEYTSYTFSGLAASRMKVHSAVGQATLKEIYLYTYDQMDRLLTIRHKIGSGIETLLASYEYDDLGQLKADKRNGKSALRTEYAYNVRGWMKSISNPLFEQTLHFTDGVGIPCYNGNVSSMTWKANSSTL